MNQGGQPRTGHSVKRRPTRILAGVTNTDILIECAACGRPGRVGSTVENGWRYSRDGAGNLVLHCALCVHLDSRRHAPASTDD
jgi:hypothetical protein